MLHCKIEEEETKWGRRYWVRLYNHKKIVFEEIIPDGDYGVPQWVIDMVDYAYKDGFEDGRSYEYDRIMSNVYGGNEEREV